MSLWAKTVLVLVISIVLGVVFEVTLPSDRGLSFLYGGIFHVVPFNRVAFCLCIVIATGIAVLLLSKAHIYGSQ